jgi:putative ABC transport system permease protein
MNIVNRLTLRHLLLNKKRTLVTIIGVILSVSMITAVTTFAVSAQDMLIRNEIRSQGSWHARFQEIDANKTDVFYSSDRVQEAMFVRNLGFAVLEGSTNEHKPYLFVREFDEASLANFALALVEGRLPERADELVISQHIIYNGGVKINVGDTLNLPIGQRFTGGERLGQDAPFDFDDETLQPEITREYTVTGIIERHGSEPHSAPGYTVISYLNKDSIGGGDWLDVLVTFKQVDNDIFKHGQELAAQAGVANYLVYYNNNLLALYGVTADATIGNILNIFALIAIVIIMVASITLIYNAFAISISERSRQLGMMASVGATKRQKRNSVFFEGLVIGLVAIPIGLLAGTAGMGITFLFVGPIMAALMNNPTELRLVVSPLSIVVAILFSALTIFISVWIPSRRASKISPIDAIRHTQDIKLTGKTVKTSWLTRALFGFNAELALKNLKRNRRRYRTTVVSLSVSIILFLTVTAYATYITVGSNSYSKDINYDLRVNLYNVSYNDQQEFYNRVTALEQVDDFTYEQILHAEMQVEPEMASDFAVDNFQATDGGYQYYVLLKAIDDASFTDYAREVDVQIDAFDSGQLAAIAVNRTKVMYDGVFLQTEVIKAKTGDRLIIEIGSSGHVTEIALLALADKIPLGGSPLWSGTNALVLIIPEKELARLMTELPSDEKSFEGGLYISSQEPEALEEKIQEIYREGLQGRLIISNVAKAAQEERQLLLLLTVFIGGFIVLITAICIANIFNTISTSIGLRRREFAMLRSVGMTPQSFNRMIQFESIFYGIKALSFALPVSMGINYYLYRIMSDGFYFPFTLPWGSYGVAIVSVFIVVFTTMLYSSSKIKRENIIDSLRDENM